MKRILLILTLAIMVIPLAAKADYLGIKKSSETIAFFLRPPLDSLYGIQRKPDSVHIFTYADNASAATYQARSTTYPFSDISIDTLKHFTDTMYIFADAISDIDGAGGNFSLTINVQMYYDKTPTHTFATVQVINDSLSQALDDATLTQADVVNIDAWDPILDNDSLIIDQSSLEDMTVATVTDVTNDVTLTDAEHGLIADSVWFADTTSHDGVAGSYGATNASPLGATVSGRRLDVAIGGETGVDWGNITGQMDASEIATDAISPAKITATVMAEIADSVWEEDTTGHLDAGFYGLEATTGGAASITDADMGAIADSVWKKDTTGLLDAGKYGLEATTGSAATISDAAMAAIADSVWQADTATHDGVAGSFGSQLTTTLQPVVAGRVVAVDASQQIWSNVEAISADQNAPDSLESWLIGYSDAQLTNREHLFANLDEVLSTRSKIGDTAISGDEILTKLDYFDTLIYIGEHGLGIFVDSTVGNANTVIGVDGTEKNPVSTLAAARTLALALGAHRFYIHGGSTFNGASTDLGADYSAWEFYGEGFGIEIAFGGQLVTNSFFHNVTLSGAMHASGGDVSFVDCELGYVTANYNGHAENCILTDTLVVKAGRDIVFTSCHDGATGKRTPTIDLSAGSSSIIIGGFTGGIRIMNGSNNDTATVTTDGQVIISANNTSLDIKISGMAFIDDSGTTTSLDKDAVFSRSEADLWVWANTDTLAVDSSLMGEWLSTGISASISDANMAAIMDSMSNRGIVQYDSTQAVLKLRGLYVTAGGTDSSAAVFTGNGAGEGIDAIGGLTGDGVEFTGGATLGRGAFIHAVAGAVANVGMQISAFGDGAGILATGGTGGNSIGIKGTGYGSGHGIMGDAKGSGNALNLESSTGSQFDPGAAGEISDSVWAKDTTGLLDAGKYGLEATTGGAASITDADMGAISDSVWLKDTTGLLDAGFYGLEATTGGAASITAGDKGDIADSIMLRLVAGDTTSGIIDTNTADYLVTRAAATGAGPARDTIIMLDTANAALMGAGIEVSIRDASNRVVDFGTTNAASRFVYGSRVGDAYNVFGFAPAGGFAIPDSVITTGTDGALDTLKGYEIATVASTTAKTCNVSIFIKDASADPVEGVWVSAYPRGHNLKDSAGTAIASVPQRKQTDVNGQVTFTCYWSSYIVPETKWRFQGHSPAIGGFRVDYTVPRQASVTLDLTE